MMSLGAPSVLVFLLAVSVVKSNHDWDYMLFSQRWPNTACTEWKEVQAKNFCSLPRDTSHWIIHGIWPTKTGTEGPNFCSHIPFDAEKLLPIKDKLEQEWTNIEMPSEKSSFWKHEWRKHGTCAASLPEMDSEFKYFSQGLNLAERYNIAQMLSQGEVIPSDSPYSSDKIYNAVVSATKKVPAIHCIHEKGTGKIFLSEIRLCLNKTFDPIDCEGYNKHIFNCGTNPSEEVILYPVAVAKLGDYVESRPTSHWLYKALYVLRLLWWFSL